MSRIGIPESELPTPCLVANRAAMERNHSALVDVLRRKGKRLRAHAKTHKCSRLAAWQIEQGAIGVCAAKLSEAEALVRNHVGTVLLTSPVVTDEAHDRLLHCLEAAPDLRLVFDDLENARRLSQKLVRHGKTLRCLVDIDPGFHRTGVPPESAVPFAHALASLSNLRLEGLQSYAGDLQHVTSAVERMDRTRQALRQPAEIFRTLREQGLIMEIFSVGGTGTLAADVEIPEVTEIQAGSYLLMDSEYLELQWPDFLDRPGSFEPALSLLCTVVSANHKGFATVDAGLKALYRDGAIPEVLDPEGAVYEWFGDEYGKVTQDDPVREWKVGQRVRLSISHVDPTINLFDRLFLIDEGRVAEELTIDLRGCSQ
jgi:D-serine deaminase-like pyridoxal phosphate-dependent protein